FTYAVTSAVIFAASRADSEKIATDLEIAISFITFNEYETLAVMQSTVYKDKPVYVPEHSAVVIYYPSKDEKLWGIAKKYNTTEDAIRKANSITGDYATGNMLVIPKK
ncbi:MAG: LysM peptidoglycan-binding domain-containing protein, partial [Eubacteriales bacterium]